MERRRGPVFKKPRRLFSIPKGSHHAAQRKAAETPALGGPQGDPRRRAAAAGAAVCQPADGSNKPDYMLVQGALTPAMKVAYGMSGRGAFARLVRFDKGAPHSSLPLSAVAKTCLDADLQR